MPAHAKDRLSSDLGVACLLAGLLTLAWSVQGWADLSALRLPDTDDAVRLQQIRDWLGGQAFGDLAQHRLGAAPGLEMHWSRLAELVPAGIILGLSPLIGAHAATLVAIILWPALLFAAALALIAGIARTLGASGPLAALIAALAYPATTLFAPGRIDHHGLQMVLLLAVARAAIGRGSAGAGAAAGIATTASLVIGLETSPLLAIGGAAIVIRWIAGGSKRLIGYALALAASLAAAALGLRTSGWDIPACDGFTTTLWQAAQLVALAPLALAAIGHFVSTPRQRLAATAVIGLATAIGALLLSPACLHPYGQVDPLLARLWLAQVAEAQPLFGAPSAHAIGYAGLMLVGIGATLWAWRRSRDPRWAILLAFQLAALAVTLVQLRGAYAGALLAAPALAALIAAARARGTVALVPAWLASAGLLYPIAASALDRPGPSATPPADCTSPAALAQVAALPQGTVMAPIDMGAFLLAASPHRVIAAPYHRGGAGNGAMYRFYLGPPAEALALARAWRIDYVAWCDGGLGTIDSTARASPDAFIRQRPAWLTPVRTSVPGLQLYRVTR